MSGLRVTWRTSGGFVDGVGGRLGETRDGNWHLLWGYRREPRAKYTRYVQLAT